MILTICLILLTCLNSNAQETKDSNQSITITSTILAQNRELLIYLPEGYSTEKKYPVSYILDGELLFEDHKNIVQYLAKKRVIPHMIVVGIVNTTRSLDLTHIADSTSNFKPNGEGNQFQAFITKELIPFIDSSYATAPYRILSGHSIGGLFATKLLLNAPKFFNAFMLIDPALWWANMEIFTATEKQLANPAIAQKKLFLAIAHSLPTTIKTVESALKDTSNATIGIRSVFRFKDLLKTADSTHANWVSQYYSDESHGTLPFISTYDGLKHIFSYYKKPSFQTLTDYSHIVLDEHYQKLSAKLGYEILPSAYDLSGLAWRCQELDKNNDRAYSFLDLYIKYYPNDPLAYMQMGQHFEIIGQKDKAQEYYQKGIALGYNPNGK